jgi:hypothetical protein
MSTRLNLLTVVASLAAIGPALAQSDQFAMAHAAAANQLGVLEYCQTRGDVGADAVAAQRASIAHLPPSTTPTDAAEALGKQGTLAAPNGAQTPLESVANAHGTTVSSLCKQMGSATLQSAAAMQQNGMSFGGTAMPKMPAMPSGMALPKMPGMPTQ